MGIASYNEYRTTIQSTLAPLAQEDALRFCLWCIGRIEEEFGEIVWDSLSPDESRSLRGMIAELQQACTQRSMLPADRAGVLQAQLEHFGPQDPEAAIEVEPDGIEFRGAVWHTLELCRRADMAAACAVSEKLVNCWDYRVDMREHAGYTLDTMFTHPPLRRELELQCAYAVSLASPGPPN